MYQTRKAFRIAFLTSCLVSLALLIESIICIIVHLWISKPLLCAQSSIFCAIHQNNLSKLAKLPSVDCEVFYKIWLKILLLRFFSRSPNISFQQKIFEVWEKKWNSFFLCVLKELGICSIKIRIWSTEDFIWKTEILIQSAGIGVF